METEPGAMNLFLPEKKSVKRRENRLVLVSMISSASEFHIEDDGVRPSLLWFIKIT